MSSSRSLPTGVDIGIQEGHGNEYKTIQKQRLAQQDLRFEFPIRVKEGKDGQPNFLGSFAQGPANGRFIYWTSALVPDKQTHRGVVV